MGRGKAWTPAETQAIVAAYVNCTTNSIKGNQQKSETFWTEVQRVSGSDRPWKSIKEKVNDLNKVCMLITGISNELNSQKS